MASERDREIWDDATNAVCQAMQEQKMCNCPDGDCLAAKIDFSPEKIATATHPAPAATDTGLVTVGSIYINQDGECEETNYYEGTIQPSFDYQYLCLRSQVEELLEAERAEKEELRRAIMGEEPDPDLQHGNFLEMAATLHLACDGARKRAEYAEQRLGQSEAELKQARADNAAKDARIKELESGLIFLKNWVNAKSVPAVKALEAKLAAAEKALEKITNWPNGGNNYGQENIKKFARAVLGGKPS